MKTAIELANECQLLDGLSISPSQAVRYAALVEAAYIERLLDGVLMPEPQDSGYAVDGIEIQTLSYIQMHEFAASAVARKDAEIASLTLEVAHKAEYAATTSRAHESACHERDALKAEVERLKTAVADEREACAVIAETPISGEQDDITMEAKDRIAAAIRARGNT